MLISTNFSWQAIRRPAPRRSLGVGGSRRMPRRSLGVGGLSSQDTTFYEVIERFS